MKKLTLLVLFTIVIGVFGIGCLPSEPPYPYENASVVNAKAQAYSDGLKAYIKDWKAGKVPSLIPENLLPDGIPVEPFPVKEFYVMNPTDKVGINKMNVRKAKFITNNVPDFNHIVGLFPDPHATYMMPASSLAPFGSTMTFKGQFPHCRFFSAQITPSFDPRLIYWFGAGEVPIVDSDMTPDSGSVNPFLVGANRNATNRNYTFNFIWKMGDPQVDNGTAFTPPYYRKAGNTRYGTQIIYKGPWWDPNYNDGHNSGVSTRKGMYDIGAVWIRYYGIDKNRDWMAGVPIPDWYQTLDSGEQFIIWTDPRKIEQNFTDKYARAARDAAADPASGADKLGLVKQWGIMAIIAEGMANQFGADKGYIRRLILGVTGKGESQPGAGGIEPSTTCGTNFNYLCHGQVINTGKVGIMMGKMPTFPATRNGEATMAGGKQLRYLSFTTYNNTDPNITAQAGTEGAAITSIMDDEIVLDANRNYVVVYSKKEDRPTNATTNNKVTWVDWGPTHSQSMTIRWISVYPDWYFDKTPNESASRCPYNKTSWSGSAYDPNILGKNDRTGFLKEYHPVFWYMTKASFEGMGATVTEAKIKAISWGCGNSLGGNTAPSWLVFLPLGLIVLANGIWIARRRKK